MAMPKYNKNDKVTYVQSCQHYNSQGYYELEDGHLIIETVYTKDIEQKDRTRSSKGSATITFHNFYTIDCPFGCKN